MLLMYTLTVEITIRHLGINRTVGNNKDSLEITRGLLEIIIGQLGI